ncbi:metal-dependent hydrolase [Halobacteriales archaeon QH_8_64_26]|nr:MAG: metal-dependent hydrolase [Halobacteriales archaeon QH_8_64_26]
MWPWGHLAVGYVLYSLFVRAYRGRPPDGLPALLVALGTQFPDLVDKPLAWTVGLLASGRSLAHSLLTATIVIGLLGWYARRQGRSDLAFAFAVGYLSHLFGDAIGPVIAGEYVYLSFLGWPLLPPPPYESEGGLLAHFGNFALTPTSTVGLALGVAFLALWYRDGTPGLDLVRSWLARFPYRSDRKH